MKSFFERHKSLLSIALTVTCSVLMVAFVVSAATTIGTNITTTGNLTVSGTAGITGLATFVKASSANLTSYNDFMVGTTATTTISGYSTSTFYSGVEMIGKPLAVGDTATTTIRGSVTSTFGRGITAVTTGVYDIGAYGTTWRNIFASGTLLAFGGTNATTTMNLGSTGGTGAKGSCIILTGENGTLYYLTVTSTGSTAQPWAGLRVSTASCL